MTPAGPQARGVIGRVYHAPFDVVFSDFDVVEPDLLYISAERAAEVLTPQHVRDGDGFARPLELSAERGDLLTTPVLPALELPLPRIFRQ